MANGIVVLNSGSTSVKFAAYRCDSSDSLNLICRGEVEGIGSQPSFAVRNAKGELVDAQTYDKAQPLDQEGALKFVIAWLEKHESGLTIIAVGHRVVLGGPTYDKPVLVDHDPGEQVLALELG